MQFVNKKMKIIKSKNGQTMLIVTILLGGVFIIGTGIAGLLMYLTLQNTSDVVSSNAAIFAADSGMENALYCYFQQSPPPQDVCTSNQIICASSSILSNGALASSSIQFTCSSTQPIKFTVTSYGFAGKVVRTLERNFNLQ